MMKMNGRWEVSEGNDKKAGDNNNFHALPTILFLHDDTIHH
jgi:hypothetical protein